MKTFEEVLQEVYSARLRVGGRSLVCKTDLWTVYEHTFGQRGTRLVIETDDKEEAIKKLVEDCEL